MTALECAFALLKCSPIGNPENSSEYGRVAYILSEHCQGKEDVSEAAMRIFAERIECLERERGELQKAVNGLCEHFNVSPANTTLLAVELLKIERERDEARELLRLSSIEANALATSIQKSEYSDVNDFQLCESVAGVISQINNMYAGVREQRDEAREERDKLQVMRKEVVAANKGAKINAQVSNSLAGKLNQAERERDEARELLRILVGLVAYGLGQSGEEWSLDAMRQATSAIQKSLEESK